jgi:signal transduction histidine kinase/DNA-binding response OmpR family regulator/ligand-binding sensor domain-containing protein
MRKRRVWSAAANAGPGMTLDMAEDAHGHVHVLRNDRVLRLDPIGAGATALVAELAWPDGTVRPGGFLHDAQGRLWMATRHGLWRFDSGSGQYALVLEASEADPEFHEVSAALAPQGEILFVDAVSMRWLDPVSGALLRRLDPSAMPGWPAGPVLAAVYAPDDALWLRFGAAIARWEAGASAPQIVYRGESLAATRDNAPRLQFAEDGLGRLWVAGRFGVGIYHPPSGSFRPLRHDPADPASIGPTTERNGYRMFQDSEGSIWLGGGLGGLSRFAPGTAHFQHIRDRHGDRPGSGHNIVRALAEQVVNGETFLWAGEDGGGLVQFRLHPDGGYETVRRVGSAEGLPHGNVWALAPDPVDGALWVANHSHLLRIESGEDELRVLPVATDPNAIRALRFAADGRRLWVGTYSHILQFEFGDARRRPQRVAAHALNPDDSVAGHRQVFNMLELSDGRILVATTRGASLLDPDSGALTHIQPWPQRPDDSRNWLFGLAEHPAGTLWLGSRMGGLGRLALAEVGAADAHARIRWFTRADGLADNTVYAILPEPGGALWLSSNRGLTRFDPASGRFRQFSPRDGLQHHEFNNTVAHIGASGRYYFGGINGSNAFRPELIGRHPQPPRLHLMRVSVAGRSVAVGGPEALRMALGHGNSETVIGWVGLHFADPARIRYAYRMEGADAEWVDAGAMREVRYPRLDPGHHRFWLRAANSDGVWSEPRLMLEATVAYPPWRSWTAYVLYALLATALFALAHALQRRRQRQLERLVAERTLQLARQREVVAEQAERLRTALDARTVLFANVSHEFRTPLTLIQAALDRLQRAGGDSGAIATGRRYVRRLLRLVDQLLELARLRQPLPEPEGGPWALDRVVAMTTEAFRSLAEQRGLALASRVQPGWRTRCPQPLVERILLNLIGNAIKFTPAGGSISVELEGAGSRATLAVVDTGPGIAPDQQDRVFDRFHRSPAVEDLQVPGAGIGLALVREAAAAIGGEVRLESTPGEGSRFQVTLPAWRDGESVPPTSLVSDEALALDLALLGEQADPAPFPRAPGPRPRHRLLIVEDNADLRVHLGEVLGTDWTLLQAGDGAAGLALAREQIPDLILSDVMMPRMDGLDLLAALREDLRTSHIPVLLLTARQDHETRLRGLSLAADDFLAKPFDPEELRLRLRNMLDRRRRVQAWLASQDRHGVALPEPGASGNRLAADPPLSERDLRLLTLIEAWLAANHAHAEASVEQMASAVSMDLRTLQRKLKALTGRSPGAHLRAWRIEQACRLLQETDRRVTDIALSCGFSSVQYFSRVFSRLQGMPPEAWRGARKTTDAAPSAAD